MFKEQMNKLKSLIQKNTSAVNEGENNPNKRKIENMIVFNHLNSYFDNY